MLDKLKRYLSEVIPDTQVTLMLAAVENVRIVKGDIVDFNIEQALYQCRDIDNLTGVDLIRQSILLYLEDAINEFGITLNEDYLTTEYVGTIGEMLRGLIELEHYEDKEVLLTTINSASDSNDCIAELIATVTLTEMTDYLSIIDRVNSDLIDKIRTIVMDTIIDKEDVSNKVIANPRLRYFIQLKYYENVLPQLVDATKHQPHQLTLESILRLYGNQIADYPSNQYSWVYALLVAKNEPTLDYLNHIWGNYFLDELTQMDAYNRTLTLYQEILSGVPDEENV